MNKIKIVDDILSKIEIDDSIELEEIPKNEFFDVTTVYLTIKKDANLTLEYSTRKATKLNVKIKVENDVNFELFEYRYGKNFKVQYQYNLMENSSSKVYKFYDVKGIKEMDMIYLVGDNASIDYHFKTVSTGCEKYSMTIYHQAVNTVSNIFNSGVNILKGSITFSISSFVLERMTNCNVLQDTRIINLTDNKCQIRPNLFIDEYDVVANHAAHIGKFSDEEMFYLNSRGLDKKTAESLLITGFLTKNMPKYLENKVKRNIKKYWG